MINPQWLELPMSQTNFHGPKDVWAIEVRLYIRTVSACLDAWLCDQKLPWTVCMDQCICEHSHGASNILIDWVEVLWSSQPIRGMSSLSIPGQASSSKQLTSICAHSFPRNWQLPFLNQQKGENYCRKYVINLHERMLLDLVWIKPQPPDHQLDAHQPAWINPFVTVQIILHWTSLFEQQRSIRLDLLEIDVSLSISASKDADLSSYRGKPGQFSTNQPVNTLWNHYKQEGDRQTIDTYWQVIYYYFLTLVLLNPDIHCLCKQCRSRSVGFWRSQLIWIYTVCH